MLRISPTRRATGLYGLLLSLCMLLASCAPARPPSAAALHTIVVGGRTRTYLLHVPPGEKPGTPLPLLLVLHGAGGDAQGMAQLTGFNAWADKIGFLAVYPNGVDHRWNDGRALPRGQTLPNDVTFLTTLVRTIAAKYPIDPQRIYVAGYSDGALMALRLACARSAQIAGVGIVAGAMTTALARTCKPQDPVSLIAFDGTADPAAPFAGGAIRRAGGGAIIGVMASMRMWAGIDGAASTPTVTKLPHLHPGDPTRTYLDNYGAGKGNSAVEIYVIDGGGHTWPGTSVPQEPSNGPVGMDVSATAKMIQFFEAHPKQ